MSQVTATRSELLARRSREGVARRGHTLLTQKRAALIAEFRRLGLEAADKRAELERIAGAARQALGQAMVVDGPQSVASAAIAAGGTVRAEVSSRSVAGVRVIELDADRAARARTERGYALTASTAAIDLVAESFEAELDALLDLAAAELNLRRLTAEVARTTRQVNALEQVVIPRLAAEQRFIAATLEQRALEDRVRVSRRRVPGGTGVNHKAAGFPRDGRGRAV
ncbi:MAG TPA: V-type ATP synthase subunit D [Streptosporangiaceae bacterium]|jgi:V/A-type H+-transporting ATPase subunit D|nr:V-type ATP synthase subunit D [Streptosporangiaceae bacterium]